MYDKKKITRKAKIKRIEKNFQFVHTESAEKRDGFKFEMSKQTNKQKCVHLPFYILI